jgi:hypothetical protein
LEKNLSAGFVQRLFEIIHKESIDHQSRVMNIVTSVEETPLPDTTDPAA